MTTADQFYCCKLLHASFSERLSVTVPFARNYSNCNSHASCVIRMRLNVPVFIIAWIFISNYVLFCILNTGNCIFFISSTVHLNISVLLHMTSCYLTEVYGTVRRTCCLHHNGKKIGAITYLWKVGTLLPKCTTSRPWSQPSSATAMIISKQTFILSLYLLKMSFKDFLR